MAKKAKGKIVATIRHEADKRKNIPTAELQSVLKPSDQSPKRVKYPRNTDLDPQLVWRGKDEQDWSDLVVHAPPLYIQEKVHPKVLIDDLLRVSKERERDTRMLTPDLFADFNGIPKDADKTDFYQHDQNWSNRMILGDSLQVMASLAEREGLRGKVQCIYFDPPYGIRFNSNFQWSTTSKGARDEKSTNITREPEQVKAFRDTWRDGIHSYLTYTRDRLTVARDLLSESGSIFVQIGDENIHRVRSVLDEVFGPSNFVSLISFSKTTGLEASDSVAGAFDYLLWYSKDIDKIKYRPLNQERSSASAERFRSLQLIDGTTLPFAPDTVAGLRAKGAWYRLFTDADLTKPGPGAKYDFDFQGSTFDSGDRWWGTQKASLERIARAHRLFVTGKGKLRFVRAEDDASGQGLTNNWSDVGGAVQSRSDPKVYVVQTGTAVVQRCVLLTTDPGDLVLDPTCGSGTTATVAELWGRRWITIDTSRVALALARARIMGARYPYYILSDSREGQLKEAEASKSTPKSQEVHGNIRLGFVYQRVPHITLKSIANNSEIDVIAERWDAKLSPLLKDLNSAAKKNWRSWEVPLEADKSWPERLVKLHSEWWMLRTERQREIDKSIASKAECEYLYDRPYEDRGTVRVAGPFTVESLSPHRTLAVDEHDELIESKSTVGGAGSEAFPEIVLANLKTSGVQQAHKADKITFTTLVHWPGDLVCAEGRYHEGNTERRAGVFVGPEFGTVQRSDLVAAAREASDAGFDVLIACAFNYEAHTTEFSKLGRLPVLKARMNADLHMADDLKNTGKGNLFVVFGEPDISVLKLSGGKIQVKVNGVDVFKPQTGEVVSHGADGIACWFIDTNYNEESFFVRHAYFLGANDPYSALKTTLKAEINAEAWSTLKSDTSRPFDRPKGGRIAIKVINHLGDEVMKVFKV